MSEIFQRIAQNKPPTIQDTEASKKWFREQARSVKSASATDVMTDQNRFVRRSSLGQVHVGQLVMYFYDPKTKAKLPYYDRFPLIFPIEMNKPGANGESGFLGINLHYLSPVQRAKLMDALYKINRMKNRSEKFKLNISYKLLKGTASLRLYKPCLKHYLYPFVRSRFFIVKPEEWDLVVALPLERFETGGAKGGTIGGSISKHRVWSESMAKI